MNVERSVGCFPAQGRVLSSVLDRKAMAEGRPILQGHNSHPQLRLPGCGALSTYPDIALGIGAFSC
jgi:hypothetical protein